MDEQKMTYLLQELYKKFIEKMCKTSARDCKEYIIYFMLSNLPTMLGAMASIFWRLHGSCPYILHNPCSTHPQSMVVSNQFLVH